MQACRETLPASCGRRPTCRCRDAGEPRLHRSPAPRARGGRPGAKARTSPRDRRTCDAGDGRRHRRSPMPSSDSLSASAARAPAPPTRTGFRNPARSDPQSRTGCGPAAMTEQLSAPTTCQGCKGGPRGARGACESKSSFRRDSCTACQTSLKRLDHVETSMTVTSKGTALSKAVGLVLLLLASVRPACASIYEVGPGQKYINLGDVPWFKVTAGDTVNIHYRPTPYAEKILISGRGTAAQWIRVIGIPGPNGELPIISGKGATTSKNMHYRWQDATGGSAIQWDGVIQIAVRADDPTGPAPMPAYIEIAGLQVQDGYKDNSFVAENGVTANYDGFAACIYARSVQHILVRNNILSGCGQGFYNWTGSGTQFWDGLQADTVLRGNYFLNNGNPGSYTEHQSYTESDGVTIEYNRFGAMRTGAFGSQLKD